MGFGKPRGQLQDPGLLEQAVCSLEARARLQGPLRRLQPLIRPPLAPKNNILVCLLDALRDRDRLFIPAISDAALLRPPGPPACGQASLRWSPVSAVNFAGVPSAPWGSTLGFESPSVLKQELLTGRLQADTEPLKLCEHLRAMRFC